MYVHYNNSEAIMNRRSYQERGGDTLRGMIAIRNGTYGCGTIAWEL